MTGLERLSGERPRGSARLVGWLSQRLGPEVPRRDIFVGAAVAATALAVDGRAYALRPTTAYATICGPGNLASSGWTVFCATVNKGLNACPAGTIAAGWWKAAGSSWCGGGSRYIVDCNATCTRCTSGCSDGLCDSKCWSCSCGAGSTATCDQRRYCCNAFRYGQCNTQVKCTGGVSCRVVSCVAPYSWTSCTTTTFTDNRTGEHSSPYLPAWGYPALRYRQLLEGKSFLKASLGPQLSVGDGRGTYIDYQGGSIYYTALTGARALDAFTVTVWKGQGGPKGVLGYPKAERVTGLVDGGWIVVFEKGAITDTSVTSTTTVAGLAWTLWQKFGRERGLLGYPTANIAVNAATGGWWQPFQKGGLAGAHTTEGHPVYGAAFSLWTTTGRWTGPLGYPTSDVDTSNGWLQLFQHGAIADSGTTSMSWVAGAVFTAWSRLGRQGGVLGFPSANPVTVTRGSGQVFQHGELWGLAGQPAYAVRAGVLTAWKAAGAAAGRYGFPLEDTVVAANGTSSCRFENGTITA